MLKLDNITFRIAGRTLFDKASLNVPAGHRIGLIGPNGTGKSTLFKLITKELELDDGEIEISTNANIGIVKQDLPDDDTDLLQIVLAADTERANLLQEAETQTDPQRIADIYNRLSDIDAYNAPMRAATILAGLGLSPEDQLRPISSFSGGWRMRVALAAALFSTPDLLLLDEPTNHLDLDAIIWLENFLANYKNTLIIISHDRDILNKTVSHIVHLDQLKLTLYTGNYDQFETLRAQKLYNQQALFEKQQAQKKKMMEFVDRFRAKASKAKQAQSRLKAIEKMSMVDAIIAQRTISFTFPQPETLPPPMISIDNVNVGYSDNISILKKLNLRIDIEDRIALLGANGNGKSTLIKLLSKTLRAQSGEVYYPPKLRVGYFAQHQAEELDLNATAYELLSSIMDAPESKQRALLGQFGFDKDKSDTQIAKLSGGEKARLLFCLMSYNAPHIMLLDEPTNHLDMDAKEALIQALNTYKGCIVIVSHDSHLVESVADQLWLVKDGAVKPYDGNLDSYRQLIIDQRRKEKQKDKKSSKKKKKPGKEIKNLEQQINDLTIKINEIETQMESQKALESQTYMTELVTSYSQAKKALEQAENSWLEAQEG